MSFWKRLSSRHDMQVHRRRLSNLRGRNLIRRTVRLPVSLLPLVLRHLSVSQVNTILSLSKLNSQERARVSRAQARLRLSARRRRVAINRDVVRRSVRRWRLRRNRRYR